MHRRSFLLGTSALPFMGSLATAAAPDVLVVAIGDTINSLDIHRAGTNRTSYQVAVNAYDRLIGFGTKPGPDGTASFDYHTLHGELAESWEMAPDGTAITFRLKPAATFHDGTKVTAHDVKWSFDRAVSIGGFPTSQFAAGRMQQPEQFTVLDEHTIRVSLAHPSKLTLPDLAVPTAIVINSALAKSHATAADPWAAEWLNRNTAGSGAFRVERWDPGQQLVYVRNDHWTGGPVAKLRRVVIREVPNQSTRRALVERGDVQLSFDIPGRDAADMARGGKLTVVGAPVPNTIIALIPNFGFAPFTDKRVRQAMAYALPYEQLFQQAAYARGVKLYGGSGGEGIAWPQASPYTTDLDRARALLAQTPYKDGFEVPLSFDIGAASWGDPAAQLVQEGLSRIGIRCTIERVPGANWRTIALVQKKLPLILDGFGGWLDTPDYYFYWAYTKGQLFNAGNYDSPEVAALVAQTLDMAESDPAYAPAIRRLIDIAWDDIPRIPLWQPFVDSAFPPALHGYEFWFHRAVDVRPLSLA
jgi:peptide/nickel transport system substrate-binding protein